MLPTFILTRTFAISALFVGAVPVSYATPVINARQCGSSAGCMYEIPGGASYSLSSSSVAPVATPGITDAVAEIVKVIEVAATPSSSASRITELVATPIDVAGTPPEPAELEITSSLVADLAKEASSVPRGVPSVKKDFIPSIELALSRDTK